MRRRWTTEPGQISNVYSTLRCIHKYIKPRFKLICDRKRCQPFNVIDFYHFLWTAKIYRWRLSEFAFPIDVVTVAPLIHSNHSSAIIVTIRWRIQWWAKHIHLFAFHWTSNILCLSLIFSLFREHDGILVIDVYGSHCTRPNGKCYAQQAHFHYHYESK